MFRIPRGAVCSRRRIFAYRVGAGVLALVLLCVVPVPVRALAVRFSVSTLLPRRVGAVAVLPVRVLRSPVP